MGSRDLPVNCGVTLTPSKENTSSRQLANLDLGSRAPVGCQAGGHPWMLHLKDVTKHTQEDRTKEWLNTSII